MRLGDARLDSRTLKLADQLCAQASRSIPASCGGWSQVKAAYRYLGNEKVSWEKVLSPHMARSEDRAADHPVVLCVQDTTELDFKGRSAEGLGRLSHDAQRGMYLHPTLLVTPDRIPLGVADLWMWARGDFEPQEWRAAYIVARKKPPDTPPMLDELIHRVAVFGGFLGRKGDKDPGAKTLWEGLQRLHDFTLAIEAVTESQTCG